MRKRIIENASLLLTILVMALLITVALITAVVVLPLAVIIGAVFSIKEMIKWRKTQTGEFYTIGKLTFIKEPLSVKRVIEITFPKKSSLKQAS